MHNFDIEYVAKKIGFVVLLPLLSPIVFVYHIIIWFKFCQVGWRYNLFQRNNIMFKIYVTIRVFFDLKTLGHWSCVTHREHKNENVDITIDFSRFIPKIIDNKKGDAYE